MKKIKALISVILIISLMASLVLPSFAAAELTDRGSKYPTIVISGDSAEIVDKDGNTAFQISKLFSSMNLDKDKVVDMVVSIMKPYLIDIVKCNYDEYY